MSASSSALGSALMAQSANTKVRAGSPGTIIRKKLDGVAMPGARPIAITAASITRRVGLAAPATRAAASPAATTAAPK